MAITINGSTNTIAGLAVGGLPDGTVDADTLASGAAVPADGSITAAKLASNAVTTVKILDGAVTSAKTTGVGGITEADQWRLTTDKTGNGLPLNANFERCDNADYTKIGTGMSESSGIFSYPSTGIWQITWWGHIGVGTSTSVCTMSIENTTNNSSYSTDARTRTGVYKSSNTSYAAFTCTCYFDVTDTSNCKTRFEYIAGLGSETLKGDTNNTATGFEFVRLGAT